MALHDHKIADDLYEVMFLGLRFITDDKRLYTILLVCDSAQRREHKTLLRILGATIRDVTRKLEVKNVPVGKVTLWRDELRAWPEDEYWIVGPTDPVRVQFLPAGLRLLVSDVKEA